MPRINADLLKRLESKLGVSQARIYALIDQKVRSSHLPRHIAAIALASERGINISKYATAEDLAMIRGTASHSLPAPVTVPAPARTMTRKSARKVSATSNRTQRRGTTVFVVHGRNHKIKDAMFTFLRSVGLKPLEWNQAIKMTGQPSPYVGTILETAFREAAAIVVLFTPDDEARLRKKFLSSRDPAFEKELTGQARPNVLFEAGMAFGKDPNSTLLVEVGDLRPFSDVAGRHALHMANDPARRQELVTKLANAGCNVDTSGSDWLTAGDFDL